MRLTRVTVKGNLQDIVPRLGSERHMLTRSPSVHGFFQVPYFFGG
jgi:hypothetical protein